MLPTEGDIIHMIQHIGHFHTAGNPGRREFDETQELYYPPICRAIAAKDDDGYVGQEFTPGYGETWAATLEQAYKVCNV
jgi:hydroxypyruvate isomerase